MIARADIRIISFIATIFVASLIYFNFQKNPTSIQRSFIDGHAVMIINLLGADQSKLAIYENLVHFSLNDLDKACSIGKTDNGASKKYAHKKDKVFLVHAHEDLGKYCFHVPSHLSFEQFVKIAQKFYENKGLKVTFHQDYKIGLTTLNNLTVGFEGQAITLDEYKKYGNLSVSEIELLIKNELDTKIKARLQDVKEMRPFFNWHLKIPVVGVLPQDTELPNEAKPLSWYFSAWDLAPKKGEGVSVVVIDTGSSSFDLPNFGFKKHPNSKISPSVADLSLNLVSENGLCPLHQLSIVVKKYCKNLSITEIEPQIKPLVIDFLTTQNAQNFTTFLLKNCADLKESETVLSQQGKAALEDILYGEEGILPNKQKGFFSLAEIGGKPVIAELLPSPVIKNNMNMMATHGTFVSGVINAQPQFVGDISGIAPNVSLFPIKALEDDGSTTKQNLDQALRVALTLKPDIVNLSLKSGELFDETDPDDASMKNLIGLLDYVVAASGNNGDSRSSSYAPSLAYPAKFESVEFDVAGFKFENYNYPVGSFSQIEKNIGPKFAAPGFNMLNSAIDSKAGEMCHMFMGGTSAATPVITGCLALALGEFKNVFSRETILKVLYASTVKMDSSSKWKTDIILGMIDIRTALLCLHTLKEIYKQNINLGLKENDLITHIIEIIFTNSNNFSSELEISSLRSDFAAFHKNATIGNFNNTSPAKIISIKPGASIADVIQLIITALKEENNNDEFFLELANDNQKIADRLKAAALQK